MEKARKGRYSMRCSALGRRALRFSVGAALCTRNPSLSSSFALFAFHTKLYPSFIISYFHIEGVVGAAQLARNPSLSLSFALFALFALFAFVLVHSI